MLKNLKKVAAIVLSFAMAVQFGLADSYYVNAVEEPVEPQQQEETTTTAPQEQEEVPTTEEETPQQQEEDAPAAEETNEQSAPETKSVELSYVAEDGTVLHETASRDFNLDYSLKTDSSVMLNFDGYTLKDVIINNSQTVPADQANLSVTSDLVSVKFVYVSVNIKEDKQTSENNEQTKTEEASEDDAEADPETKEELPEYPAFDQSEAAGNVVVHATAAEGVLPRDSKLVVKRITRKAILNAVEDTVSEKNKEMDSAVALDITIQNKDGVEIQPNGSVNISFENAAVSGDEINIYHVTDDASAVTEVATNTQSFDANHFSIYVITGENKVPLTTFNFVDANGKPVSTQIVKTGDTLITPTAPDVAGKAFVEWQENGTKFDGFGVQKITKTETRTITAKYVDALYVYFLKPDGSQIMRTEKVEDHKDHDYSHVSYDVDATHKLVGWAEKQNGTDDITKNIAVPEGSTSKNVYAIIQEGHWVTFDSDGGSAIDSQFVLDGNELTLNKSTTPTKPGYEFVGWYDGLTKVEDGSAVTTPMTLKARWEAAQVDYTINYWQQKVTDDKNATDAQKTYEYVKSVTNQATTGKRVSATDSQTYKGFKYNENNSSKDVEISGDGTTIINVYYDRVLCTVKFHEYKQWKWQTIKTVTGLYGANLPEGVWDSSSYWTVKKSGGTGCILLTSFDFETAGYADNQDNVTENGVITTCNFYRQGKSGSSLVHYYNEQADGTFKLVQTINTTGSTLNVHEKYVGYDLYKYTTAKNPGTSSSYWEKQNDVYDGKLLDDYPVSIASKLKTYSLSYYNYNGVAKTVENIKYTASLESYANYTPEKPSGLPEYYEFGGWYKDKACTTKFDFNTEKMPNANVQIYAKWTAKKIKLTYNLNTPDGTSKKVNSDVDAGTIASTELPSATTTSDYSFAGWYYADDNGNITKHAFNVNEAITKDTNVIGKWLYNGELKVSYVADGVEAPKDNNVYAGGAKAIVANGVTKEGKKFLGWQLVDGNVYQPGQNFEVNKELAVDKNVIILTAVFGDSETSAILNYHPGNGDGKDQSVAILNNVEVTLKNTSDLSYTAPGKDYYFAGWATSMGDAEKGNAKYAVGEKVRVNADPSNDLYATWVKKTVIEVTANSKTLPYNGEEQKAEGFKVTAGYEVTGLKAEAKGTNVGTYDTEITGPSKVTKDGVDVTDKVIVNKINGTLTISKREVTLTSQTDSKPYDGTPLTRPDVTITGGFVKGEVKEVKATGSVTNVSDGEVPNTITYETSDKFNANNYTITKNEGKLSITPVTNEVTVRVKGNKDTATYDGKPHSVNGYEITDISNKLYTKDDVKFTGQATATGKDANTYPMNLDATQFVNNNTNFSNVKFEIAEDGQLVINPRAVTLTSEKASKPYDGTPLTRPDVKVEGNFVDGEVTKVEATGSVTYVSDGEVTNTIVITEGKNFKESNYSITKNEGKLSITPVTNEVTVTIKGNSKKTPYNGEEQSVSGYTVESINNTLYSSKDFTLNGQATATGKDANTYPMNLDATQFVNNNTNFSNVKFEIAEDGQLVINPRAVTLTSEKASKPYDGTPLTRPDVKVEGNFVDGEVTKVEATGSVTYVSDGEVTNTIVITEGKNFKESNYSITKNEGKLSITPVTNEVTVRVKGNKDTATYDGKPHSVNGYEITDISNKLYTKDDVKFTGQATATGKDANTYPMNLDATQFVNNNTNFSNVKFEIAEDGQLVINPRAVTLTSEKASKPYDGTPLTRPDVKVEGNFVDGEVTKVEATGSVTYVSDGEVTNTIVITEGKNFKESNYSITKNEGKLSITPVTNEVTVRVKGNKDTATYDGKPHSVNGYEITDISNKLYTKDDVKFTGQATATGKDANTYPMNLDATQFVNNNTNFSNVKFEIAEDGQLVINPRAVTLTSEKASKPYDGTPLTRPDVKVEGNFVDGEVTKVEATGSVTYVSDGEVTNTITFTKGKDYKDVNYKIEKEEGKLSITAKSIVPDGPDTPDEKKTGITVSEPSDSKYDGKEHKEVLTVTDTKTGKELVAGTDYSVTYSSDLVNAGTVKVTVAGLGNYTGSFTKTYKITKRSVTLTSEDGTKPYDGTALTKPAVTVSGDGFVEGEVSDIKATGSVTTVSEGEVTNTITFTKGKDYKDVNYKIEREEGKLSITAKSIVPDDKDTPESEKTGITVNEPSDSKYDGKEHKEVLTVTDTKTGKELVAGTDYSITYSSDLVNAGTVTIKVAGLGNYTGSFEKTYKITKRSVTLTSATVSKVYDGSALTNTDIAVSGDGFVEGEGASYEVTGTQTEVGNSANAFEYKLNEKTLASNYNITKVVGTLTITAAPAPVTPATPSTPSTPSSTTRTTPRTLSAPQVTTPAETVEKETTPKAEPKKEEKVEEEYTPKASPQYYWALINLICAILTVLFGLLLLISKRHKDEDDDEEDDDEEDDETKQQTTNDDEEKEQEKKRGLFTRVLAVLIAIVSVVFFLVTEDLSLPWTWTDQWTIWMVVIGLVQIVVFFVGRKWKNVDNDDEDEEAQQA